MLSMTMDMRSVAAGIEVPLFGRLNNRRWLNLGVAVPLDHAGRPADHRPALYQGGVQDSHQDSRPVTPRQRVLYFMPFSPADPDDADDLIATEVLPVNLHSRQLWHRRSVQTQNS
jgi:hypothetical protein